MELGRHEASLRATINGAIERTKQPDSEALLSEMQAGQLAEHIQDVAREHAGAQAGNSPTPQKSSGGTSAHSGKTDSQCNHEPAKLTAYSNIKNEERLEMVNGAGQPAHVTDVCVFAEEVAKNFVLMEGFEPLCEQLEQRKTRPSLTYEEFANNGEIPGNNSVGTCMVVLPYSIARKFLRSRIIQAECSTREDSHSYCTRLRST